MRNTVNEIQYTVTPNLLFILLIALKFIDVIAECATTADKKKVISGRVVKNDGA